MTTPTPAAPSTPVVSGTCLLTARATAPVHHGAGTSGNTALLRTQTAVTPDGRTVRVPYVSGNSLRHGIRDALAWHAAATLGLPDGSLSKACADLLWSGGALTSPGARTDLDTLRHRHRLLAQLSLLGYAHGSDLVTGALRPSHAYLACAENTWRAPAELLCDPAFARPAADWRDEDFGTRHDIAGGPVDRLLAPGGPAPDTTQMIYEVQVVRAGSLWWWTLALRAATPAEADALMAAVHLLAAPGWTLGAKAAAGYGTTTVQVVDLGGLPDPVDALAAHTDRLTGHADEARALLAAL